MIALAIILSTLLLIALLRFGVIIEYTAEGATVWLKIGFVKIKLNLEEGKHKRRSKFSERLGEIKPGSYREFMDFLDILKDILSRLQRRLLVKNLIMHYISGGTNPAKVAMQFGAANAAFGVILPVLERHFHIKKRDIKTSADFDLKEPYIYVKLAISMATWEAVNVLLALIPMFKSVPQTNERKGGHENGERANKQPT